MNPKWNINVSNDNINVDFISIHSKSNNYINNVLDMSSDIWPQKKMRVVTYKGIIVTYTYEFHLYLSLCTIYGYVSIDSMYKYGFVGGYA